MRTTIVPERDHPLRQDALNMFRGFPPQFLLDAPRLLSTQTVWRMPDLVHTHQLSVVGEHRLQALEIKFTGTDLLHAEATRLFQSLNRESQHPTAHDRPHHVNEMTAVLGLLQLHGRKHRLRGLRQRATVTGTLVLHQAVQR